MPAPGKRRHRTDTKEALRALDNRLFLLAAGGVAAVLLFVFLKVVAFTITVLQTMRHRDEGGEIRTHGDAVPGVYTVLSVRDYYDGMRQGVRITARRQGGERCVFWTAYDPFCAEQAPQPFRFFDTLVPADRISIQVDEEGGIRAMAYYG